MTKILVVTGSRWWRNVYQIQRSLTEYQQEWPEDDIVLRQGCASGADAIARSVASFYAWDVQDYWPDYMSYGFAEANKKRNIAMLETTPGGYPKAPDQVYAFPTERSRGTWHAVNAAKERDIPVKIINEN